MFPPAPLANDGEPVCLETVGIPIGPPFLAADGEPVGPITWEGIGDPADHAEGGPTGAPILVTDGEPDGEPDGVAEDHDTGEPTPYGEPVGPPNLEEMGVLAVEKLLGRDGIVLLRKEDDGPMMRP